MRQVDRPDDWLPPGVQVRRDHRGTTWVERRYCNHPISLSGRGLKAEHGAAHWALPLAPGLSRRRVLPRLSPRARRTRPLRRVQAGTGPATPLETTRPDLRDLRRNQRAASPPSDPAPRRRQQRSRQPRAALRPVPGPRTCELARAKTRGLEARPPSFPQGYGPRQISSNLSILTVSVEMSRTNNPRALKRSPEAFAMMSVCLNIKTWPLSTKVSVPWPTNPSLVVIVLWLRATVRESCMWTNAVPTNVTVIGSPVHGLTSGNTSRIGNSVGGSAAAGTANARVTTLNRPITSLFRITPRRRNMGSDDGVRPCQVFQLAAARSEFTASSTGAGTCSVL
jgi:hypothetical protein